MKQTRRWLAGLLCTALLACLLPTAALAEDAPWAGDAVEKLNGIYGEGVFSADDGDMTEEDVNAILEKTGWETDVALSEAPESPPLTRTKACDVLADVFRLPVGSGETAITYLYEKNIINGEASGNLNPNGTVSKAQFAVLTYRVLNAVGGGMADIADALKPGTDAYFAWMYLAARRCVSFQSNQLNATIGSVTNFTTYGGIKKAEYTDESQVVEVLTEAKAGEAIWNAWVSALSEPRIGGLEDFDSNSSIEYNGDEPMIAAATRLMGVFIEAYTEANSTPPTIFTDVTPDDWWYDGVMYSFDESYINGLGNGTFEPETRLPLYEFAVLLYRINPVEAEEIAGITLPFLENIESNENLSEYEKDVMSRENVQNAMKAAVSKGYLSWADGGNQDFDPTETVSRQHAIADILKACAEGKSVALNLDSVNTGILDRFADADTVKEAAEQYIAYAVSRGMVSGTTATTLAPNDSVTRAQAGVLLYRTLIGLDESKMQDYRENVSDVLTTDVGGN